MQTLRALDCLFYDVNPSSSGVTPCMFTVTVVVDHLSQSTEDAETAEKGEVYRPEHPNKLYSFLL